MRGPRPGMTWEIAASSRRDTEIVDEIKPCRDAEELIAVHHDGDVVLAKKRHEVSDRGIGRDGVQPRHHHVLDRALERLVGTAGVSDERSEHVTLVDEANN